MGYPEKVTFQKKMQKIANKNKPCSLRLISSVPGNVDLRPSASEFLRKVDKNKAH
jgi:hypothetical protein